MAGFHISQSRLTRSSLFLMGLIVATPFTGYSQTVPMSNLRLWLKADAGRTMNGSNVAVWADQSGNNLQATQTTASRQPVLVSSAVNGKPAFRFDGVDDYLAFPLDLNNYSGVTLVVVSSNSANREGTWAGVQYPALFWNETASWGSVHVSPFQSNAQLRFGTGQTGNTPVYTRPASIGTAFTVTTAVKNGTTDTLYVDGKSVLTLTGKFGTVRNTSAAGNVGRGTTGYFAGQIAEILVYTRALTDAERTSLDAYLKAKYVQSSTSLNKAPVVSAGTAQTITLPATATLAGTATDDGLPAGSLSTTWTKATGPGTVTFSNAAVVNPAASFSAAGTYVLRLTATDSALTTSADVTITVNPAPVPNTAPVVSAGPAQTITLPASATLAGTATDDGLPSNTLTTVWTKVSGPGTTTFSNASARNSTVSFSVGGNYVLRLSATDGALTTSSDVTITVNDTPNSGIEVYPGTDIQALVGAKPEGTTFIIKSGVHRMQMVKPRNGNKFIGEAGAIMNGSRLLTNWSREGAYWVVYGQTQQGPMHGECKAGYERCNRPEDLFINDVMLRHATSLGAVKPGMWYFDYDGDRIYIADDPAGKKVETSVSLYAFKSSASNVTIKNLIIEKYAQPSQNGAIFARDGVMGTAWVIDSNEVRLNHGCGIAGLGNFTKVLNNKIHHNGQMGLGGNGDDLLIEGNEIYYNLLPVVGVNDAWEGGGTKFALTNRLTVRGNYVHDNYGTGLWTDIDNINTVYENNQVINNLGNGITHEISYDAIIRNNVVRNNGSVGCSWLWCSQILIQNSLKVEVYGNTVEVAGDKGNGIGIISQNRGSGKFGPYLPMYNYVHHNTVIHRRSPQGSSGAVADYNASTVYFNGGNKYDYNTYHVTDANASHWQWNGYQTLNGMRSQGHEINGKVSTIQP
jgi:hypothetical protein